MRVLETEFNQKIEVSNLDFLEFNKVSVFGGFKRICVYMMETKSNGYKNAYKVSVELRGIHDANPYLEWSSAEVSPLNNNEETLIEDAVRYLLEQY